MSFVKLKTPHKEELKLKCCQYEGCDVDFMGTGKEKYCLKHRDRKYRKKQDLFPHRLSYNPNQTIQHNSLDSFVTIHNCECCGKSFEIKVIHGIYCYPKYCDEHRNEYKRNRYLQLHKKDKHE